MALATLVGSIDVHGGGDDLAFPHHAYEAAQAEAATGVAAFVRRWMRPGTVHIYGHKMAKSAGNLVFVAGVRIQTCNRQTRPGQTEIALQGASGQIDKPANLLRGKQFHTRPRPTWIVTRVTRNRCPAIIMAYSSAEVNLASISV